MILRYEVWKGRYLEELADLWDLPTLVKDDAPYTSFEEFCLHMYERYINKSGDEI